MRGCRQPPLTWSHSIPELSWKGREQTADKWKWSLVGQSLFREGILVTSNQSGVQLGIQSGGFVWKLMELQSKVLLGSDSSAVGAHQ